MTQEEKQALLDVQGTPGFRVLEHLVKQKIEELRDISNVDETLSVPVEIQLLGRKYTLSILKDILGNLGLQQSVKETNKTYE